MDILALLSLILLAFLPTAYSDVFTSTAHLRTLVAVESEFVSAAEQYIVQEEERLQHIERLLAAMKPYQCPPEQDPLEYVSHPLNAMHLVKRLRVGWNLIVFVVANQSNSIEFQTRINKHTPFIPGDLDYIGAQRSLLRLQLMYKLAPHLLSAGLVEGRQGPGLDQQDCYQIGLTALHYERDPLLALEWLRQSLDLLPDIYPDVRRQHVWMAMADAYSVLGDMDLALFLIAQILSDEHEHPEGLQRQMLYEERRKYLATDPQAYSTVWQDPALTSPPWKKVYSRMCYQSLHQERSSSKDQLYCKWKSADLPYHRIKAERIHMQPEIWLFHDFITAFEELALKSMAAPALQRAKVGIADEGIQTDDRIAKVSWLWDQENPLISRLSTRVAEATSLTSSYPSAEAWQVANYGIGGQYDPHYDFDEQRYTRPVPANETKILGDRIATLMVYLSDVPLGGATVFPEIDLFIKPVKNSAVFWYNYNVEGEPEWGTFHAACPVLVGDKWVANKWIREVGQMFTRPCPLSKSLNGTNGKHWRDSMEQSF